ncbi:Lrp/AsnC ligand binding domain-containing protein [Solwaraspora sp. WMMB335]|uniref:Lrp/AsnC ligand binding domain-containing protein n=1 Tax=Solwaraspora sp. WMMB335 TaxID=3404118 RepID=UPI003B966B6E
MLDDLDLRLVDALQIVPRTPWSVLAPILHTDASTLSRRWSRLTATGLAWTTCYATPARAGLALAEIRCAPGRRDEIAAALAALPPVVTVEYTSGPRELAVNVSAPGPAAIDRYVARHIAPLPGVRAISTRFVRSLYQEGVGFDLRTLTPAQRARLLDLRRAGPDPQVPQPVIERTVRALQSDVRRPAVDVAREIGVSVPLARRAIAQLARTTWVRVRADFAHDVAGWHATVQLWLTVAPERLDEVAAALAGHPAVRLCASTVSAENLVVVLWMRCLADLDRIESALRVRFPQARVTDRWLVPRAVKRMGNVLDAAGRRSGYVAVS